MDHSRALGHSADGNQATADGVLKGDGFRAQVGRHDRPSGIRASTIAELSEQLRYALDDSIDRQPTTDHTGRTDEYVLRGNSHVACKHGGSLLCGSQSIGAGTGVGVTTVHENGSTDSLSQVQTIDNDRRCDHLIFREDAGDGTALL